MSKVHTQFDEIIADVMKSMERRGWGKDVPESLESRSGKFKKMLIEAFVDHSKSGRYPLICCVPDHILDNVRRLKRLYFLGSGLSKYFNAHIMQAYERTTQKRHTKMMKTIGAVEWKYKRALIYWKTIIITRIYTEWWETGKNWKMRALCRTR